MRQLYSRFGFWILASAATAFLASTAMAFLPAPAGFKEAFLVVATKSEFGTGQTTDSSGLYVRVLNYGTSVCDVTVNFYDEAGTQVCSETTNVPINGMRTFGTIPYGSDVSKSDVLCAPYLSDHEGYAIVFVRNWSSCNRNVVVDAQQVWVHEELNGHRTRVALVDIAAARDPKVIDLNTTPDKLQDGD